MKKLLLFLTLFITWHGALQAQVRFYAKTDAYEVLTNSYFEVEFVLENAAGSNFNPPDFQNMKIVSGPNQSSQISIVNGKRSQKKGFSYTLLANAPGKYIIGPAEIKVNGTFLKTEPIQIKVVKGRSGTGLSGTDKEVFVRAEISDTVAYPGQQLLLRYVLYTTKRVSGYNFLSEPVYEGFFTQKINTVNEARRTVIDGVEYQSQTLQTVALFPQQLGDLNVESIQVSLGLALRNDPFSIFQSTQSRAVITNDLWVRVIPLPDNPPVSFKGALGKFSISTSLSNRNMTTDDAVSLNLKISGNGLPKFIEAPELDLGGKFEVYDPKVIRENMYPSNNDIISEKTFEYLLVPAAAGRQNIQVEFSYFDTDSSKYITLFSPNYTVTVSQGENKLSGLTPEELLMKYQLRPMMVDTELYKKGTDFFNSAYFWVVFGLLLTWIPGLLLWKYIRIRQGKIDPDVIRRKRASKEALKRLAPARLLLERGNHKAFYKAISDALYKYFRDKFTVQTTDLTNENVRETLQNGNIRPELIEEFMEIIQKSEMAIFAPTDQKGSIDIYDKTQKLVQEIEWQIKGK